MYSHHFYTYSYIQIRQRIEYLEKYEILIIGYLRNIVTYTFCNRCYNNYSNSTMKCLFICFA